MGTMGHDGTGWTGRARWPARAAGAIGRMTEVWTMDKSPRPLHPYPRCPREIMDLPGPLHDGHELQPAGLLTLLSKGGQVAGHKPRDGIRQAMATSRATRRAEVWRRGRACVARLP